MKTLPTRAFIGLLAILELPATVSFAKDSDDEQRLQKAATVLSEIIDIPDNIPQDLIDKAECLIVMPSVKKFAIGIGGNYGKGAMVCRGGAKFDGPWGAPAAMRLEGASIGFQLGGSATDFVLLIMNPKGAESLLASKVKLGADALASCAASPVIWHFRQGAPSLLKSCRAMVRS